MISLCASFLAADALSICGGSTKTEGGEELGRHHDQFSRDLLTQKFVKGEGAYHVGRERCS